MGYRESYCFACGCPLHNKGVYVNADLYNKILKIAKKVLTANVYRIFHLNVSWLFQDLEISEIEIIEEIGKYKKAAKVINKDDLIKLYKSKKSLTSNKKYNWLNNVIWVNNNGKNITITKKETEYGKFFDKSGNEYIDYGNEDIGNGFVLHRNCHKLLESKYGKLNYFSFDFSSKKELKKKSRKTLNSNAIPAKYQTQNIPWIQYFLDKNDYLLENPLTNAKNKKRILNIKFNIIKNNKSNITAKYKNRPSPSISASQMTPGTINVGTDGNKWIIIVTKRWTKIKSK